MPLLYIGSFRTTMSSILFGRIGAICGGRLNEIIHHLIVTQVTIRTASTGLDSLQNKHRQAIGLVSSLWGLKPLGGFICA